MKFKDIKKVTAFAPATVANVAVGFDILGFAVDDIGDYVTLVKRDDDQLIIRSIEGVDGLPFEPDKNVVSASIKKVLSDYNYIAGFDIVIKKGIPLGSGMGGSAASTVAGLVAFNQFLETPLSKEELVPYTMFGEEIATGHAHSDNVVPSLYGGLTLTQSANPVKIVELPVNRSFHAVVFHPEIRIDTKLARSILKSSLPLKDFVRQSANLAGFISGLYLNDLSLIRSSLNDELIEPHRSLLIPEFQAFKAIAKSEGALGCSISGSGPTIFALAESKIVGEKIQLALNKHAESVGIKTQSWVCSIRTEPAVVIDN